MSLTGAPIITTTLPYGANFQPALVAGTPGTDGTIMYQFGSNYIVGSTTGSTINQPLITSLEFEGSPTTNTNIQFNDIWYDFPLNNITTMPDGTVLTHNGNANWTVQSTARFRITGTLHLQNSYSTNTRTGYIRTTVNGAQYSIIYVSNIPGTNGSPLQVSYDDLTSELPIGTVIGVQCSIISGGSDHRYDVLPATTIKISKVINPVLPVTIFNLTLTNPQSEDPNELFTTITIGGDETPSVWDQALIQWTTETSFTLLADMKLRMKGMYILNKSGTSGASPQPIIRTVAGGVTIYEYDHDAPINTTTNLQLYHEVITDTLTTGTVVEFQISADVINCNPIIIEPTSYFTIERILT